jgi:biopolymer transport protein ExbD
MDINRLRALVAAPLASLFLILVLCTFGTNRPAPVGIHIPITRVQTISEDKCFDDRDVFVRILKNGSIWINETRLNPNELGPEIAEIMRNRNEQRVVYILPGPDISYGDFANVYNKVASSTKELHVGLITRQLKSQLEKCPLESICGLDWPDHGYLHSCINYNIPPVLIPRSAVR